jgi:hypothetical protein
MCHHENTAVADKKQDKETRFETLLDHFRNSGHYRGGHFGVTLTFSGVKAEIAAPLPGKKKGTGNSPVPFFMSVMMLIFR